MADPLYYFVSGVNPYDDEHDNIVLIAFRDYLAHWPGAGVSEVAMEWLDLPADKMPARNVFDLRRAPFYQILHAQRVFAKLALLEES